MTQPLFFTIVALLLVFVLPPAVLHVSELHRHRRQRLLGSRRKQKIRL